MWLDIQILAQVGEYRAAEVLQPGNPEAASSLSDQFAAVEIGQCLATSGEQYNFGACCHKVPDDGFRQLLQEYISGNDYTGFRCFHG